MRGRKKETNWEAPSREEWQLKAQDMDLSRMIVIAKIRKLYHGIRCRIDNKQCKQLNIDLLMEWTKKDIQNIKKLITNNDRATNTSKENNT